MDKSPPSSRRPSGISGQVVFERMSLLLVASAVAVAVWAFWPGLSGPFIYDDASTLLPVRLWALGFGELRTVFEAHAAASSVRPVAMVTFLMSSLFGTEPYHFKLGNLVVHCLAGAVVYLTAVRIISLDRHLGRHAPLLGAATATIWLLLPIHVSTVLYSAQRMSQLAALFTLLSLWTYIQARMYLDGGRKRPGLWLLFLVCPVLILLGIGSKENAAVAPVLCLLVEGVFLARSRESRPAVATFASVLVALPALLVIVSVWRAPAFVTAGYSLRDFSLAERLATQPAVLLDYVRQAIIPQIGRMGVFHDDFPVARSAAEFIGPTVLVVTAIACAAAAARFSDRWRLAAFGALFYVLAHAIEGSVFPLDIYYEHRNYLPNLGLLLGLIGVVGAVVSIPRPTGQRTIAAVLATIFSASALSYAASTRELSKTWSEQSAILEAATRAHPGSFRAVVARARHLSSEGEHASADVALATLAESGTPRQRFLAHLERLGIRCNSKLPDPPTDWAELLSNYPDRITLDDVQVIGLLLFSTRNSECPAFPNREMLQVFVGMLERSAGQNESSYARWQLRLAAALAASRVKDWQSVRSHAEHARLHARSSDAWLLVIEACLALEDLDCAEGLAEQFKVEFAGRPPILLKRLGDLQARYAIEQSEPGQGRSPGVIDEPQDRPGSERTSIPGDPSNGR